MFQDWPLLEFGISRNTGLGVLYGTTILTSSVDLCGLLLINKSFPLPRGGAVV